MGTTLTDASFGRQLRHAHFLFRPGYVPLNQGSYGAYPRQVQDVLRAVQDEVQQDPDGFVRYVYPERLNAIRTLVADFLHADVDEIVLVANATTGLNAVLRNMTFHQGEKIAHVQGIYGAIEKTIDYLVETTAVESVCVPFDAAVDTDDVLLDAFRSVLKENHGSIKVAVFDTVMSMPGLRMPFERLTKLCREFGVLSVIDGAHGIGLVELDLKTLNADFLVTNCHKYVFICVLSMAEVHLLMNYKMALCTTHMLGPVRCVSEPAPDEVLSPNIARLPTCTTYSSEKKVHKPLRAPHLCQSVCLPV